MKDYLVLGALFDVVGMCRLVLPNAALLKELAEKVKQIEGVKQASIDIVVEHVHDPKILVTYLENRDNEDRSRPTRENNGKDLIS